jgi:glycosyltransferase involved in cell wall biosynthesis
LSLPSTQILLSAYNGAPFLEPLLESLLGQHHPPASILVRDDGSTDSTVSILERYGHRAPLVHYRGPHVGAAASFLDLLERADPAYDSFAFCDQDDVWLPGKLSRAVDRLGAQPVGAPALYCGRRIVVDAALAPLTLTPLLRRRPSFENALVENIAAGCTVVLNRAGRRVLTEAVPNQLVAHDWWAYLVVSAFGTVLYDEEPQVLYRQHRANVVGADHDLSVARRLRRFQQNRGRILNQALEFHRLFGARLDACRAHVLERFLERRRSLGAALAYALRPDVFRQAPLDHWVMRALFALRLV